MPPTHVKSNNDVVPALFNALFPSGSRLRVCGHRHRRAGAGGGDVDRRGQSVHPQFLEAYVNPNVTPAGEAKVAKIVSLVVKVGALVFILFLPTQFALDLQLLGGVWILQTFPSVVFGLFFGWFGARAALLPAGPSAGRAAAGWRFRTASNRCTRFVIGDGSYTA
jgi:SSS family solute:Na+ symporter